MATAARNRSRRRFLELAGISFAAALLGWFVLPMLGPVKRAQLFVQDMVITHGWQTDLSKDFVFLAIDDPSMKLDQLWPEDIAASPALQSMQKWPWPRNVYADALRKIIDAGARAVILDLVLDEDHGREAELREVLDRYPDKVVLGMSISPDMVNQSHQGIADSAMRMPTPSLIPDPTHDRRVGFVNFWANPIDGTVRSATYRLHPGLTGHPDEQEYLSLSAATLRQIGLANQIPGPGRQYFRSADFSGLPVRSFYSLFLANDWRTAMKNGELFRNKIVVIGPSAAILHDTQISAQGTMPGPTLHIVALAAAMQGAFYVPAAQPIPSLMTLLAAATSLLITARIRQPVVGLGTLIAVAVGYFTIVFLVANFLNCLLPGYLPVTVLLLSGVSGIAWNFAQERRESGRMRSTLERYVSRNVVREILDNRDDFLSALGGTRRPMTVFFSDVRGFTSFSERADATAVVEQLNEYLGEMVAIIFRNHGTVDKFMGDGILAVWGNVVSKGPRADATDALRSALEMLELLPRLNARWEARGLPSFSIGIGLHHGEAVFGNIGSAEKMEPTVIGDTVNLASRVEGLTKKYGVSLCVTQPLAELLHDEFRFRPVDLVQVVGKSRPVEIFTVLGPHDMELPDWIKLYEGGMADFRARRFAEAAAEFRRCLPDAPDDKLLRIFLARSEAFLLEPPPPDWNGAEIATSK